MVDTETPKLLIQTLFFFPLDATYDNNQTQRTKNHMTTATKIVNYTDEQTATARSAYLKSPTKETVAELAESFGKSIKSVIAKLSREGVYVKAVRVSKAGGVIVSKDALVTNIAHLMGVNEEKLDGLDTAPKAALILIANAMLWQQSVIDGAERNASGA